MAAFISVIILCYNRERYLGEAIASVLNQTHANFELLVWDDGSTDRSLAVARGYAAQDGRVRVVAATHSGAGGAMQGAIAATTGAYVGWVDSDDRLAPTALAQTVAGLEADAAVGMVYSRCLVMDQVGRVLGWDQRSAIPYSKERLLLDFMTFHFRLLRRSALEQAGGIDPSFQNAFDYDLCLRLSEVTEIRQVPQPLYYYRRHPLSLSGQGQPQQLVEARRAIAQALQRRGLGDRLQVNLKLVWNHGELGGRYSVQPKQSGWLKRAAVALVTLPLAGSLGMGQVLAQAVTPARDGTRTTVTRQGNRLDISGGQRSRHGRNLFHSFRQFGLSANQIANFQSNPQIRNILARVTGGDASVIDGILRVTGGQSNLFLLNPAGVVFGASAQLDLPASFTATTASGIGMNGGWFSAAGSNDYASLVGSPTYFAFTLAQPGAIVNAADLSLAAGQNLTLLGGSVTNTGQISVPAGQITVASVPGQNLVRLSQPGGVLSLDIQPGVRGWGLGAPNDLNLTPPSLPELLTGGAVTSATGLTVNPDGSVALTGSGISIPTTAGTTVIAGGLDVSSTAPSLSAAAALTAAINVVGDRVALTGATVNANGINGGGTVQIGGGYQGRGTVPNSDRTFVSADSTITADALQSGDGGRVILWANQTTAFAGQVSARGGTTFGDGGFVEISGKDNLSFQGTVDLSASAGRLGSLLLDPTNILISDGASDPATVALALPDILLSDFPGQDITISVTSLLLANAAITLEASNNIQIASGLNLSFGEGYGTSNPIQFIADADNSGVGDFIMDAGDSIFTNGRDISISGANITVGTINTNAGMFRTFGAPGASRAIRLEARNDITAGRLETNSPQGFDGGDVFLNSQQGDIAVTSIDTSSSERSGGNVTVSADRFVATGTLAESSLSILTRGPSGAGSVDITHAGGALNIPFTVGGGAVSGNGTVGDIDTGDGTLTTGSFPVLIGGGLATLPAEAVGISIRSVNDAPTLTANQQSFRVPRNRRLTIPVGSSDGLLLTIADANGDTTTVRVTAIAPGVTLSQNGEPVLAGSVISTETPLQVRLASTITGPVSAAFTLVANDPQNVVGVLAASEPVSINLRFRPRRNRPTPVVPVVPVVPVAPTIPDDPQIDCCTPDPQPEPTFSSPISIDTRFEGLEASFTNEFTSYLGLETPASTTLDEARDIAREVEAATGIKPAFVYLNFVPAQSDLLSRVIIPQATDQLELVVVTAQGGLVRRRIPEATRAKVFAAAREFRNQVTNPANVRNTSYLASAQQLYGWFVAPIQADLQALSIGNLVFLPEAGLRSLPFAALHDGQQFLVEQYSVGIMPSISLTDTRYVDVRNTQMLAMGISASTQGQTPLPAVPTELNTLVLKLWRGRIFLDDKSTLANLQSVREQQPFGIIHLATHADFLAGPIDESYIQFWNDRLRLDQVQQLRWNDPPVEMLVLSACRTALGNEQAELGFAGMAVQTGVKTAVASLWYVSDAATSALMTRFYQSLSTAPIKAEALRQAQIGMARGTVFVDENGRLQGLGDLDGLPLPADSVADVLGQPLSHPYYWAAFTMIGNPW